MSPGPDEQRGSAAGIADGDREWPELAFVMAPGQNLFFEELVHALRHEIGALGGRTSLHLGGFPAPRDDLVYVLVPPHEYFALMYGRVGPPPEALQRTIFICAEQPGTTFFDSNVALAPRGGALFDINRLAVQAFGAHGIEARHLQLGWSSCWEGRGAPERDIDVLFVGCLSDRRARALASYARSFADRKVQLVLSDNSRPNSAPSESFHHQHEKWELLARTKVLVNLHQDDTPYFEWLRIVQAIANGAVVVSEHSVDFAPLVPARHLLLGSADSLHLLAMLMLDDDLGRERIRTGAYDFLRDQLSLSSSAAQLAEVAARIATSVPRPDQRHAFFSEPPPNPESSRLRAFQQPPSPSGGDENAATIRRALKDIKLDLLDMRRSQRKLELSLADGRPPATLELVGRTRAYAACSPRVSVLTALFNYEEHVLGALNSALATEGSAFEIIVVDDGSSDRSLAVVHQWMREHEDASVLLLRHPVNRGLAHARNSALGWARGEYCFVLDADNEIYPHCLRRLAETLDDDVGADFSYGTLECFRAGEPVGLLNTLPWEPSRLRTGNYIDAMAMIRTGTLRDDFGGYAIDRRLHGWEDFELWCRMAEAERRAIRVPEMLARYRLTQHSMLVHTNISATDAFSLIIERNPRLMAGIEPPG